MIQVFQHMHWTSFAAGFWSAFLLAGFVFVLVVLGAEFIAGEDLFIDEVKEGEDYYSSDEIKQTTG